MAAKQTGTMNGRNGMAVKKAGPAAERKLRGFSVDIAANGGAIVRHDREYNGDGPYQPSEQHVFTDAGSLHKHLQELYPGNTAAPAKRANVMEPGEQA